MPKKSKRARGETAHSDDSSPSPKHPKTAADEPSVEVSSSTVLGDTNKMQVIGETSPAEARTAVEIQRAIGMAPTLLPALGTCPLVVRSLFVDRYSENPDKLVKWEQAKMNVDEENYASHAEKLAALERVQEAIQRLQGHFPTSHVQERHDLREDDCTVTLKIAALQTLLGKEETGASTFCLDDFNEPISKFAKPKVPALTVATGSETTLDPEGETNSFANPNSLLRKLFEIGTISPFGQVKTLKTIVDESVHRARQIDAEYFSVSPAFISRIEELWAKHFYPSSVTAVPYKIKLYDSKGQFQDHKDTPETGLVGTFLVGLTGEYVSSHLRVLHGKEKWHYFVWSSENGCWCAFYPDVVHSVLPLEKEHKFHTRGTIAFKIFAKTPQPPLAIHQPTLAALKSVELPFGILLNHDYTVEFNEGLLKGGDAALFAVLTQLEHCHIRLLPVITSLFYKAGVGEYRSLDWTSSEVTVYPFNETMIRACLAPEDDPTALLALDQWPKDLANIPFITARDWDSKVLAHCRDDGSEHTGNECRPAEQHSIYISAAILVLPN